MKENHIIIPTDAERAFDKIRINSQWKKISKPETEGNFFKLIKDTYTKTQS